MSEDISGDIAVTHSPAQSYFQITVDGELVGQLEYVDADGQRIWVHTEIADRFEGHGLAGKLVRQALDATRAQGLRIVVACPYVKQFVDKHEDWNDLRDPVTALTFQHVDRARP